MIAMVDANKRLKLLQTIVEQPEHVDGQALVSLSEFFDGNDDLGSIGCNLMQHPGIDFFYNALSQIQLLPCVDQVWIEIYDFDEGDWPFSENVLIFGDATTTDIEDTTATISPSDVYEMRMDRAPSRDPSLKGCRYLNLWWD